MLIFYLCPNWIEALWKNCAIILKIWETQHSHRDIIMDLMIKNQDATVVHLRVLTNGKCLALSVREIVKTTGGRKHDNH